MRWLSGSPRQAQLQGPGLAEITSCLCLGFGCTRAPTPLPVSRRFELGWLLCHMGHWLAFVSHGGMPIQRSSPCLCLNILGRRRRGPEGTGLGLGFGIGRGAKGAQIIARPGVKFDRKWPKYHRSLQMPTPEQFVQGLPPKVLKSVKSYVDSESFSQFRPHPRIFIDF